MPPSSGAKRRVAPFQRAITAPFLLWGVLLVRTFRARDIDKFLAYLPHAELVNGTRIVEQLRAYITQLNTFMYYGNFFVGKLLEIKHLGKQMLVEARPNQEAN